MIDLRPRESLGGANHGWLDAKHHFSFASYADPARMGWGGLRVWNDDTIAANTGFPLHPHANMEIVTYVRQGAILHRDSLGNAGRTDAGDVQVMSAGAGIRHSEHAGDEKVKLFQIWIEPAQPGGAPSWGTQAFPKADRAGKFIALASGRGDAGALPIRADAAVLGARLEAGQELDYAPAANRHLYLVPASGRVSVNGVVLRAGDGAAIRDEAMLHISAQEDAELVLVDAA